jgi:hypothetical protein
MLLKILAIQKVDEPFPHALDVPLLVKHEGNQQNARGKDPPSRAGKALAVDIHGHPAGDNSVAD